MSTEEQKGRKGSDLGTNELPVDENKSVEESVEEHAPQADEAGINRITEGEVAPDPCDKAVEPTPSDDDNDITPPHGMSPLGEMPSTIA